MFRLVESINQDPVRLILKPGLKLTSGCIVKIVEHEGIPVVDICDGKHAFGILGNRCWSSDVIDFSKRSMAYVYPQRMIANIDKFDRRCDIQSGCSLYCNSKGILSSKKPFEHAIALAKVIYVPNQEKKHMQILWL